MAKNIKDENKASKWKARSGPAAIWRATPAAAYARETVLAARAVLKRGEKEHERRLLLPNAPQEFSDLRVLPEPLQKVIDILSALSTALEQGDDALLQDLYEPAARALGHETEEHFYFTKPKHFREQLLETIDALRCSPEDREQKLRRLSLMVWLGAKVCPKIGALSYDDIEQRLLTTFAECKIDDGEAREVADKALRALGFSAHDLYNLFDSAEAVRKSRGGVGEGSGGS